MNDEQLRSLVRDAVARHLGRPAQAPAARAGAAPPMPPPEAVHGHVHPWQQHASHHLYVSLVNVDGSCVIEPSVPCDHCGFCKSHGH